MIGLFELLILFGLFSGLVGGIVALVFILRRAGSSKPSARSQPGTEVDVPRPRV